jgi:hypothetical protein
MIRRVLSLGVLLSALLASKTVAQMCFGQGGYDASRVRVGGMVDLGGGYTSFIGGVGIGKPDSWFGTAGLGYTSADFGGGGVSISVAVGNEIRKPLGKNIRICPFGLISHNRSDAFGAGSATDFGVGGSLGIPLNPASAGDWKIAGVGGYTGVYQRYSAGGGVGFPSFTAEEWYGYFDAGVGVINKGNLSFYGGLRPYLRYGGGRDMSFIFRANIGVGSR